MKAKQNGKMIRVFTDGGGQGPDGRSSSFAWLREDTREKQVDQVPGLSNNEAEYRGVISALKALRPGSNVEVLTDSLLVVSQMRGEFRIRDPKLVKLATELRTITEHKRLRLKLTWIPRSKNLAGKLI
jgi:ribonuclease HI